MARIYRVAPHETELELERHADGLTLRCVDRAVAIDDYDIDERYVTVEIDGRSHRYLYAREGGHIHIACKGQSLCLLPADEETEDSADSAGFSAQITAPMPGKVLEVIAAVGDRVEPGAPLLLLEAMKMEQTIRSATAAVVAEIHVEADAMVGPGETLVTLEPADDETEKS